jgi:hypothetical protein
MMYMKLYRILSVLLVAVLVLTALGCSDKNKKTDDDNTDKTDMSVEADTGDTTEAPVIAPVELFKLEIVNEDVNNEKYSARDAIRFAVRAARGISIIVPTLNSTSMPSSAKSAAAVSRITFS